jgi:nucleoside-diphosphate-sugar epimerase
MILVTGGTGLVGSHIILNLLKEGKKVRALKRRNSDLGFIHKVFEHYLDEPDPLFETIEWAEGDILDVLSLENAMEGIEQVYHSAAMISFEGQNAKQMMEINGRGTANVVNACLNHSVKKFCYISSIAALGRPEDNNGIIDENIWWKTSKLNTNYAIAKYQGEREVWRGTAEGLDAVIVNPSIILGISNPDKGSSRIFKRVWKGLKFYPPGINGFVDVEDVANASVKLMESNIINERFILNAVNITYLELFSKIAGYFNKKPPEIKTGRLMLEAAWIFEAIKSFITGHKPLLTRETARTSGNTFRYSSEKIRTALGFTFKDFDKTIAELGDYYRTIFSSSLK